MGASEIAVSNPLQMRGTVLVALSGMLYGVMGYFGTQLLQDDFSVTTMLFWRFLAASLWILATLRIDKKVFNTTLPKMQFAKIILLGVICYSTGSAFYFLASQHIGTGLSMVIFFAYPLFVTALTWFLCSWKWNRHAVFSLLSVVVGLLLLKGKNDATLDLIGIIFAMTAAFFYAIYIYNSQHSARQVDSKVLTFSICLGNAFVFFLLSLANHSLAFPNSFHSWFYIFAIGILATALPIQLMLDGLKYISPVKASILSVLEPVVTVLIGMALLHETMSSMQAIGMLIILAGAILIQFERTARPDNQ